MRRAGNEPARPYGGHEYELVRAGPQGVYWRAAHGVLVRVAAAEAERRTASDEPRRIASAVAPAVRALFGAVFAR